MIYIIHLVCCLHCLDLYRLNYDIFSNFIISKVLECSVCFEQMAQPKMLPCQHDSLTICQYYQLSEYVIVSEIFVNIPNVILSNVIPKELSYI